MSRFTHITQKKFLKIAPPFALAVIIKVGGWREFTEIANDVAQHGASSGIGGFIYYKETVPFARKNLDSIMGYAVTQAEDFNHGLFRMFAEFNCMQGLSENEIAAAIYQKENDNETTVLNCLAWYALEETARVYTDMQEQE